MIVSSFFFFLLVNNLLLNLSHRHIPKNIQFTLICDTLPPPGTLCVELRMVDTESMY